AHGPPVVDDPVDQRLQLGELVDVVAVRFGLALHRRGAVGVELEPHHLRLGADPQMQSRLLLELRVEAFEVASAVRGEVSAGLVLFFSTPEQRAEDSSGARVPRQYLEGLGLREPYELPGVRAVSDVI